MAEHIHTCPCILSPYYMLGSGITVINETDDAQYLEYSSIVIFE